MSNSDDLIGRAISAALSRLYPYHAPRARAKLFTLCYVDASGAVKAFGSPSLEQAIAELKAADPMFASMLEASPEAAPRTFATPPPEELRRQMRQDLDRFPEGSRPETRLTEYYRWQQRIAEAEAERAPPRPSFGHLPAERRRAAQAEFERHQERVAIAERERAARERAANPPEPPEPEDIDVLTKQLAEVSKLKMPQDRINARRRLEQRILEATRQRARLK